MYEKETQGDKIMYTTERGRRKGVATAKKGGKTGTRSLVTRRRKDVIDVFCGWRLGKIKCVCVSVILSTIGRKRRNGAHVGVTSNRMLCIVGRRTNLVLAAVLHGAVAGVGIPAERLGAVAGGPRRLCTAHGGHRAPCTQAAHAAPLRLRAEGAESVLSL